MRALSEWDSKGRFGDRLPRPAETLASTRAEALQFVASHHGPFVAKASGVAHKTERRLVRLGLDRAEVGAAWDVLAAAGDGRVLLAEQIDAELELMVGAYRDPGFGPLVTLGIGGIAAEVFGDMVAILAPPEPGEVVIAAKQLAGRRLLQGVRGRPAVDLDALDGIVGTVSDLLISDPEIEEIDLNPVLVCAGALFVADALIVVKD